MSSELTKVPATTVLQDPVFLRELAKVTPKSVGLTPERIARIAITSIKTNPALGDCTKESLLGCVMLCAQFGFDPGGPSGLAYLVPYRDGDSRVCTFILGYKGMIQLAVRSGTVKKIEAVLIRDSDTFTVRRGTSPTIEHVPAWQANGSVTGVYAVATLDDGTTQFEVMNLAEIKNIESRSRAKSGPWKTDWNEMARKTVVRRLCKYLVLTPEIQEAVGQDEAAEHGYAQALPIIDVAAKEPMAPTGSERTAAKLAAQAAELKTEAPIDDTPVPAPTQDVGHWTTLGDALTSGKVGDGFTFVVDHVENTSYAKHHRFRVKDGEHKDFIYLPANGPLHDDIMAATRLKFAGAITEERGERKLVADSVEVSP